MEGKNFKNVRTKSFQDYLSECNSYKVNILKKGFQCNTTVSQSLFSGFYGSRNATLLKHL